MSLDRPTLSISGRNVDLHMWGTNFKLKYLYDNVLFSLVQEFIKIAFWSDSVDWFDASLVRRLTQQRILT